MFGGWPYLAFDYVKTAGTESRFNTSVKPANSDRWALPPKPMVPLQRTAPTEQSLSLGLLRSSPLFLLAHPSHRCSRGSPTMALSPSAALVYRKF